MWWTFEIVIEIYKFHSHGINASVLYREKVGMPLDVEISEKLFIHMTKTRENPNMEKDTRVIYKKRIYENHLI